MLLTADQQRILALRAQWYFDISFGLSSDYVTFTGCGLADLDSLISRLNAIAEVNFTRNQKFMCDTGSQYSDWRNFDIEDVYAIRAYYIQLHGEVNKPDAYATRLSTALPVEITSHSS